MRACSVWSLPPKGTTLNDLIADYRGGPKSEDLPKQLKWFESVKDKKTAVGYAASARCNGIKLPHQWRLSNELLKRAASMVQKQWIDLLDAKTFEDLYRVVNLVRKQETGLGDLWAYDTALRISAILEKPGPTTVYLQSGARKGAIALHGRVDITRDVRHLSIKRLRSELGVLSPMEAENFLCIYESRLTYGMR